MDTTGLVHLYIGNGKGKTTSAVGLAIRALGNNLNVLFAQFLKNTETGEKIIFEQFNEQLYFFRPTQQYSKFLWNMTKEELSRTKEDLNKGWQHIKSEINTGNWDVVVLDEILDCIQNGLLEEADIIKTIVQKPKNIELVLTGRSAKNSFYEIADYISMIDEVKHPFKKGIQARRGIEY